MKCFLVVNQLNNPVFMDFDAEFTKFIHEKAVELGLQDANQITDDADVDTAVVTQLFSPLVLSQVPLDDQVQNPCTSIVCPNGFLLVFKKVDDIQYIAISGDEKDTVDFLQRKILVFIRLTKFLFGPVYMEIANCSASERAARWSFLKGVLHTWTQLATNDHSFLVEALERLHVNQLVSEKSVGLLEKTVQRMQALSDHPTQHAFLLVNTKLLALYSKRSSFELQPADILLTILLAQDMFPFKGYLEDLLAVPSPRATPQPRGSRSSSSQSASRPASNLQQEHITSPTGITTEREDKSDDNEEDDVSAHGKPIMLHHVDRALHRRRIPDQCLKAYAQSLCAGEFHSAPTTPSKRSSTPDPSEKVHHDNPQEADSWANTPDDDDEKDPVTASSTTTTTTNTITTSTAATAVSTTSTSLADDGRDGGGDVEEEAGDGGLERLMTSGTAGQPSAHKASFSSGNKESTTSSSAVETEYPTLSPQAASGINTMPTNPLLPRQRSSSDTDQRSRSSTAEAKHSFGSRRTPSDLSSPTLEIGSSTRRQHSYDVEQSSRSQLTQGSIDYWPHTVFLQTPSCQYAPHNLYCAQVLPGITVVVISQVTGYSAADPLCQVLSIMQDLLQGRRNKLSRAQALHVHDVICDLLKKCHSKKVKKKAQNSMADIIARWENADMREKLTNYLQQEETIPILPSLESILLDMRRRLKEVFQLLFVSPSRQEGAEGEEVGQPMSRMKMRLQQELMDYREYLSIKAQRNITMTSYLDDFPGLIHFIYVDRQFHQMTAPSFNIIPDQDKMDATLFLKEKVWMMYGYMMKKLQQGYTSVLLREGDFYYSYFLWFEDRTGNPLPVQEAYRPGLDTPKPGTLTGTFYKRLLRQCFPNRMEGSVHCYEMFLMHVGLVTPQYIAAHCQKLAHKLWEMSGEAYTPVNLL